MPNKFNVFDEWGNKVGEYTPTGGSTGDGFIMVIALFFLWTVGFLIYTLFRLIGQGIKEAKLGNWNKAISYLAVPVILTTVSAFVMIFQFVSETIIVPKIQEQQFQKIHQQAKDDAKFLDSNPVEILIKKENLYLLVEFKNNWYNPVEVYPVAWGRALNSQYTYSSTTGSNSQIKIPSGEKIVIKYQNHYTYQNTISETTSLCVKYTFIIDVYDQITKYSLLAGHTQQYCQDI